MNFLEVTYALNGTLMVAMPLVLAILLIKRWKHSWRIWWIGLATFILSQIGHIPFNWGVGYLLNRTGLVYWPPLVQQVFNAAFLGLSAGLFEEGTRYFVLRFWAKEAHSWRNGILFGAGHGGAEAIILGILVLVSYVSMLILHRTDISNLVPASQLELTQQQVAAYWAAPWYDTLLGAVERFFTIPIQISMAVLVMQVFTRKKIGWLFLAILYHAFIDGMAILLMPVFGSYWVEVLVGGFAILSIAIIAFLRQPEPIIEAQTTREPIKAPIIQPVEDTPENLEESRFLK